LSGATRAAASLSQQKIGAELPKNTNCAPRHSAGGLPGVKKAVDILRGEIDLVMGQIGCPRLDQLGPDFLWRDDWPRNI
jgi:L-lactate dehydrogenase (cytochrome)/(S)-mandelate dehydrogenase